MPWTLPFDAFKTPQARRKAQAEWLLEWVNGLIGELNPIFGALADSVNAKFGAFLANHPKYEGAFSKNKVGVTPFDLLLAQTVVACGDAYGEAKELAIGQFMDTLADVYARACYDVQWDLGKWQSVRELTEAQLRQMADAEWFDGQRFSDRLWADKDALERALRRTLAQGVNLGWSAKEMAERFAKCLEQARYVVERLIRTEANRLQNQALIAAYKANGVEKYEYVAILDERTSEICEELDGRQFPVSEAEVGVNVPPMHPNCRSSTIPIGKDSAQIDKDLERLDYEGWVGKFLKG